MNPQLLFCHFPFGKDCEAIREYVATHQYDGVEWGLDSWRVMVARGRRQQMLDRLRRAASLCSLHAPYTDLEIGHRDAEYADAAVRVLQGYIDAAADMGAHHLNLHVGSFAPEPEELSWETLVRNLATLMNYAARRRTAVTVENLRHGPTSDPDTLAALLRHTGAPVTFDLGHAHGSAWVQGGRGSVADFLKSIPTPILAGHLYFTERDDSHFAPTAVDDIAAALDGLWEAGCDFWVLELHTRETLEQTRRIVDQYLEGWGGSPSKKP
ncbi:MAG: sugar phosphate isomerase/epimerase [candidate division NC10 bacterium]|nr:sugar phosphate isomerase/epimerase [candidate division NC10 bacterium]